MNMIPQDTPRKQCTGPCKQFLPATSQFFHKKNTGKYGFCEKCKECSKKEPRIKPPKYDIRYSQSTDLFTAVKRCTKCRRWQHAAPDNFTKNNKTKDKLCVYCKQCMHKPPKPSDVPDGHKRCPTCKNVYPWNEEFFHRTPHSISGFEHQCSVCKNARSREYSMRPDVRPERLERQTEYNHTHKEKLSAQMKVWHKIHRESERQRQKRRHIEQREYVHKRSRQYYQSKKATINAKHRAYYDSHRELFRERGVRYSQTAKGKMVRQAASLRRRVRKQSMPGNLTTEQIQQKLKSQKWKCYYAACGHAKFEKRNGQYVFHVEHTIPVSRTEHGPRHDASYTVLACPRCNWMKGNKMPHEWVAGGTLF